MKAYRHGDVIIVPVNSIPKNLPLKKDTILLEGEATGHFHRLHGGKVYSETPTIENKFSLGFFELTETTPLTHEEHKTIELPPGKYHFYSQREYDPQEAERRVID